MKRIRIEKKKRDDPQSVETLRKMLVEKGYARGETVDVATGVTITGLPVDVIESALLELCASYPCRVDSDRDGKLYFRFGGLSRKRGDAPLVAGFKAAHRALAKWREPALAVLTLLLFPLFGAFGVGGSLVIPALQADASGLAAYAWTPLSLFALLVATAWGLPGLMVLAFVSLVALVLMFLFLPFFMLYTALFDTQDAAASVFIILIALGFSWLAFYGVRAITPIVRGIYDEILHPERAHWARRFWQSIGGLVFGPPVAVRDELHDERKLLRHIRISKGVISAHDLLYLFGWDLQQSDSELVGVLLDYGGEIVVTDSGSLLYVFDSLTSVKRSARQIGDSKPLPFWEEASAKSPAFFGGTRGLRVLANFMIGIPVLGTLIGSLHGIELLPAADALFRGPSESDATLWASTTPEMTAVMQGFGLWPWIALAAILTLRAPAHLWRSLRYRRFAKGLPLLRGGAEAPEGLWVPEGDLDAAVLASLDGTVDYERGTRQRDGAHEVFVCFPQLAQAQRDVAAMR